ncbi:MAG TPA: M56 family metallopeptidase [Desulfobacteria bacterium]|nr:M56 family metallopeptidase [Desulfobacteria bacterium]
MTYDVFINKFIHPFILYVVVGTLASYLMAMVITRLPVMKNSKSRALLYSVIFLIPFIAYAVYRPFFDKCVIAGHPLGIINDKLCTAGEAVAKILTPLFLLVTLVAVFKGGLSIYATRKIVRRYGYAQPSEYPDLFRTLENLCHKAGISMPGLIVTRDKFARAFTMGCRNPSIVISNGIIGALDDGELETLLAHELGHIIRNDSITMWVMVFLRDLMFFAPVVYWIFRDLSCEKEMASDDYAIELTNKPLAFAEALIKVWRLSPKKFFDNLILDNFIPHPNFITYSGILEHRVRRILNNEHINSYSSWVGILAVCSISVLAVFIIYWIC